jgi:hypothetical protein
VGDTVVDDPGREAEAEDDELSPLARPGTTLVVGPSNVGKTTLTARALERWLDAHGAAGVVVFDFGPEVERDGRLLGGRLDRFTDCFDRDEPAATTRGDRTTVRRWESGLWQGVLDAHAPRTEGETDTDAISLARENAMGAARLFDRAPASPRAVFVNDATIAFQHDSGDPDRLLAYCARAAVAVVNAFAGDELGSDDAVSRQERTALDALEAGADRTVRLW